MWREVLAEEFPNQLPTWCVIVGAKWALAKATAWNLLFTIVKITLQREKGCYTLKTSTLPWLLSAHQAISYNKAERK